MRRPALPAGGETAGISGGRDITRGYIEQLGRLYPLRDPRLRSAGATFGGYEVYENMLADDRVQSTFMQRRAAVVSRALEVLPGDNRRKSKMAADHLREMLEHCGWDRVTDLMLYGIFYGFSVAECMWARDGRHVVAEQIRVRDRKRFVFDQDFRPLLRTFEHPDGEELPDRKFWTFSTGADHDDEPYGLGLGWHLYWPVWFKRNQVKFWLVYLEKFGMPTAIGKHHPGATPEERRKLHAATRAVHGSSAVTLSENMEIALLEAKRAGRVDYADFYKTMQAAITTVVLSQTMTTEDGSSRSQSETHMQVRQEVTESDDALIGRSFRNGPARWLTEWNFPGAATPIVRRIMDDPPDTHALAERDKNIAEMRDAFEDDYLEETYNVRLAPRRDEPPIVDPRRTPAELAEDESHAALDAALLSALAADEGGQVARIGRELTQPILTAAADDPDVLGGRLQRLFPLADDTTVKDMLARVMYVAELVGYAEADTE